MRKDYYLVEGAGPIKETLDGLQPEYGRLWEEAMDVATALGGVGFAGARGPYAKHGGGIACVIFAGEIPQNWKRVDCGGLKPGQKAGYPKRTSKELREVAKRLDAVRRREQLPQDFYAPFGWTDTELVLEDNHYGTGAVIYSPWVQKLGAAYVVMIPVSNKHQADPPCPAPDGCRLLQEWEYMKLIADYNASLHSKADSAGVDSGSGT